MLNSLIALLGAAAFAAAQPDYQTLPQTQPTLPSATARPAAPTVAKPGQPAPAVASARTLQAVPNITIRYYDVTGKNQRAIMRSMARQRPKDSNGEVVAASTNWDIGATMRKRTENGQCRITGATLAFTATADLPRLVDENSLRPEILDSWRAYVGVLEAAAAAKLWFVHDRIGAVEKAILASSCDNAQAAGAAAVERIKQEEAALTKPPAR